EAGEECAQRRRCRLAVSRRTRYRRGRQGRVDLREAAVSCNVLAPSNDAVGKGDARLTAHEFAHLEARGTLAVHEEPAAITLGREEHAIVAALNHLGGVRIESHDRAPARELRRAEILEPMLRALHAMEHARAAVGEWYHGVLHGRRERARDLDVAREQAGEGCRVGALAEDADVVGKADHPD